jgi:hypothetical protein
VAGTVVWRFSNSSGLVFALTQGRALPRKRLRAIEHRDPCAAQFMHNEINIKHLRRAIPLPMPERSVKQIVAGWC